MTRQTLNSARDVVESKYIEPLDKGLAAFDNVIKTMHGQMGEGKIMTIFAQATMVQKAMFLLCLGWMHLWSLTLATSSLHRLTGSVVKDCTYETIKDNPETLFYYGKILTARFFIGTEFPKFFSYVDAITNDEQALTSAEAGIFTGMP